MSKKITITESGLIKADKTIIGNVVVKSDDATILLNEDGVKLMSTQGSTSSRFGIHKRK